MLLYSAKVEVPNIKPDVVFNVGPLEITSTMFSAFLTMIILVIFAVVVRLVFIPRWNKTYDKKSPFRLFLEAIVSMFDDSAAGQTGHNSGFVGSFYFSAAAFICLGTLMEVTGLRPATSDLNVTLALGLASFVLIFVFGFKEKKARRLLHYLNPINTITDLVVPFSLALRMFGSVFSGYLIMELIYSLPWFAQIALPAIGTVMFTIFHALIQSYIFMFLSMSFIGEATE